MYVVAIVELCATVEAEAVALSSDIGMTVYEARLLLAAGTPAIVRTTSDKTQAKHLLERLRARGHGAVACDASAVFLSHAMTSMRRFRIEPDALLLEDGPDRLPYDDVCALVAAVYRKRVANESEARERKLSVARAVASGGVVMTRTVKRETRATTEDREQVLYLFQNGGGRPWILREAGTIWVGHGRPLAASAGENFRIAVDVLRERVPRATYDDRLVGRKSVPERMVIAGGFAGTTTTTSSAAGVDLLAHLLALWIARPPPPLT